jgi:glycosyltransferase involved in cell wall biosynthesis
MILHVGRMVPRKGIDTVIRGYARFVADQDVPPRLLIVGGESDEPDPERTPEIGRLLRLAAELAARQKPAQVLLQRSRPVCHHPMVRTLRHHAAGSNGMRNAGDCG